MGHAAVTLQRRDRSETPAYCPDYLKKRVLTFPEKFKIWHYFQETVHRKVILCDPLDAARPCFTFVL